MIIKSVTCTQCGKSMDPAKSQEICLGRVLICPHCNAVHDFNVLLRTVPGLKG